MTNEEIAVRIEHNDQEIKSLNRRVKKCEEQQTLLNKLVSTTDKLAINMDYMVKEQQKQGERLEKQGEKLETLEHKPDRENTEEYKYYKRIIIGCIITGVVSAIIGAIFGIIIV